MDTKQMQKELEVIIVFLEQIRATVQRLQELLAANGAGLMPEEPKPAKPLIGKLVKAAAKPATLLPSTPPAKHQPTPKATPLLPQHAGPDDASHPSVDDVPLKLWSRAQLVNYCWELGYTQEMTRGKTVKELQEMITTSIQAGAEESPQEQEQLVEETTAAPAVMRKMAPPKLLMKKPTSSSIASPRPTAISAYKQPRRLALH